MRRYWKRNKHRIKALIQKDRKDNPEKYRKIYRKRKKYFQQWFKKKYKDPEWRKKRFKRAVKWGKEHVSLEKRKHYALRSRYNISLEEYGAMIVSQNGKCAICSNKMSRPHIDHDHVTGKVREVLCHKCNCALGFFQDSCGVLTKAISYLKKHAKS